MPTTGARRLEPAAEPRKAASPKAETAPSAAASQCPWPVTVVAIPATGGPPGAPAGAEHDGAAGHGRLPEGPGTGVGPGRGGGEELPGRERPERALVEHELLAAVAADEQEVPADRRGGPGEAGVTGDEVVAGHELGDDREVPGVENVEVAAGGHVDPPAGEERAVGPDDGVDRQGVRRPAGEHRRGVRV